MELGEDLHTALRREILEETGVRVEVGPLVSVSSNVRAGAEKVVFTLLCTPLEGEAHPREEALDAGWFPPAEAVDRVTHPAQAARLRDALSHDGAAPCVTYRIYQTDPYELLDEARPRSGEGGA